MLINSLINTFEHNIIEHYGISIICTPGLGLIGGGFFLVQKGLSVELTDASGVGYRSLRAVCEFTVVMMLLFTVATGGSVT